MRPHAKAKAKLEWLVAACQRWPEGTLKDLELCVFPQFRNARADAHLSSALIAVLEKCGTSLQRLNVEANIVALCAPTAAAPDHPLQLQHALSGCSSLRSLEMYGEAFLPVPQVAAATLQMPHLTQLGLLYTQSDSYHDIPLPPWLQRLSLVASKLPASLAQLRGLKRLVLTQGEGTNALSQANPHASAIGMLSQLERLMIDSSAFTHLPSSWAALPRLQRLLWSAVDLESDDLAGGVASVAALTQLTFLDLSVSSPDWTTEAGATVAAALCSLPRLQHLNIMYIDSMVLLPGAWCQQLTQLEACWSQLGATPAVAVALLKQLPDMRELHLETDKGPQQPDLMAAVLPAMLPMAQLTRLVLSGMEGEAVDSPGKALAGVLAQLSSRPGLTVDVGNYFNAFD